MSLLNPGRILGYAYYSIAFQTYARQVKAVFSPFWVGAAPVGVGVGSPKSSYLLVPMVALSFMRLFARRLPGIEAHEPRREGRCGGRLGRGLGG